MITRKKSLLALTAAASVAGFVAGCGAANQGGPGNQGTQNAGGSPRTVTPVNGGTITIGQPFAFDDTFIPFIDATQYTAVVWSAAFDPLLTINKNMNFVPWLAKSWKWSADKKTLTMTLQPNAHWSDGKPITSDDVLLTMNYLASKAYNTKLQGQYESLVDPVIGSGAIVNGKATSFAQTGGFTKVNEKTFQLHFASADAAVLWSDISNIVPLPSHVLGKYPFAQWNDIAFNRKPTVVSGAFEFETVSGRDSVTMTANPHYWAGKPHISTLIYKTVSTDVAPGLLANGTLDMMLGGLAPSDVPKLHSIPNIKVVLTPALGFYYLGLEELHPEFKDYRVREAFEYAIDRNAMKQGIMKGYANVINGPVPTVSWAAATTKDGLNPYNYSVAKANRLLDAAGWKKGSDGWRIDPFTHKTANFHLLYPQDPIRTSMAVSIKQYLAKVGVKVTLDNPLDLSAFYNKVQNDPKNVWMYVAAWGLSVDPDPRGLWGSHDPMNYEHWQDPHDDALIKKTYDVQAFNKAYRKKALIQWQLYVNKMLPLNFLIQDDTIYVVSTRVHIPDKDWSVTGPINLQDWWVSQS
ncbi:MAG: hypothetical protein K6T83_11105 [Alicyclobacillus sp.]|nr:hypothetical protein [Alicyclobacillus sp.]